MATFEVLKNQKFLLKTELRNFPLTFVNGLRRVLLSRIPIVVLSNIEIITKKIASLPGVLLVTVKPNDEIMDVADNIVVELCGQDSSIYVDANHNLVERGEEKEIFDMLVNYKPEEGNAGYETSPMVLHHAIQVIMARLFDDTHHELEIVRPVSCQCGWRGAQGNWDRHMTNARHLRWVNAERERRTEMRLTKARETVIARREPGFVYINELHSTPESRIAIAEAVHAAELAGDRVIFMCADGRMSWFP
jgi:hypothetical protein